MGFRVTGLGFGVEGLEIGLDFSEVWVLGPRVEGSGWFRV